MEHVIICIVLTALYCTVFFAGVFVERNKNKKESTPSASNISTSTPFVCEECKVYVYWHHPYCWGCGAKLDLSKQRTLQ